MNKVSYTTEVVTGNRKVTPDGCNSIMFENIGVDAATIDGNIPCTIDDDVRWLINDPDQVIVNDFAVRFAGVDPDKRVLVVKKFVTKGC